MTEKKPPKDASRAPRIGRMAASPDPLHREYARRLVEMMDNEDRDRAMIAYRSIPAALRRACEVEDVGPEGAMARDELDRIEQEVRDAKDGAGDGPLIDLTKSPHKLSEYLDRYKAKRGDKYRKVPLEPGENERIHAEILAEIGGCADIARGEAPMPMAATESETRQAVEDMGGEW